MNSLTANTALTTPGRTPTAEPLLRLESIHKDFGPYAVLHDLSFEMSKGEVVAIIGPSGSGKSTLLRCINQLEPPTRGRVSIGDLSIEAGRPLPRSALLKLRRRVGMVFQSFNLFPHLTVLGNVSLAQVRTLGRSPKEADARSLQLLERVGLADKAGQYPTRCSGGQQQRIAIARALALEPELMLFDEPTSALDPELVGEVLRVIRSLAEEGRTMILVTHEMAFARDVSSHVAFLHQGRIEEEGHPDEVFLKPGSERCRQFVNAHRNR
jgi:polar amino acid transport system ATP-binding protein